MNESIKQAIDAINKLTDITNKFLGYIFEPSYQTRLLKAGARGLVKAEKEKIAGLEEIKSLLDDSDFPLDVRVNLMHQSMARFGYNLLSEQININHVIGETYKELQGQEAISETIDDDWYNKFFNNVKDISNEEMQKVWSKILSGEIKKPGSFSFRTLDIVKNLSQKEANIFKILSDYIIHTYNEYFIIKYSDFYLYSDILLMNEVGLFNSQTNTIIKSTTKANNRKIVFQYQNKCALYEFESNQVPLGIECYFISNSGRELYQLFDTKFNENYWNTFLNYLKQRNPSFVLKIGDFISEEQVTKDEKYLNITNIKII